MPRRKKEFNEQQQEVIDSFDKSTLVSASAGTGKTTVMIERLLQMLIAKDKKKRVDLSNVVVVTFTKLAANQMKQKLANELMDCKQDETLNKDQQEAVMKQLEKIDTCSISTLHSFCGNLLRNYFYVVDVDPNYSMLDEFSLKNVKIQCIKKVLEEYYNKDDETFDNLYKIYASKRSDANFIDVVLDLQQKACSHVNFYEWYSSVREVYLNFEGSSIEKQFNSILKQTLDVMKAQWEDYAKLGTAQGLGFYAENCNYNADACSISADNTLRQNFNLLNGGLKLHRATPSNAKVWRVVDEEKKDKLSTLYSEYADSCKKTVAEKLLPFDKKLTYDQLLQQTADMVVYTDKLVEVLQRFEQVFAETKRQNGIVDFSDLEHFALKILSNEKCRNEICQQYKYVFVDEHQDTNPVQDEIISKLKGKDNLFLVGDVKQSIYGFRGCTPNNFVKNQVEFNQDKACKYVELNENYRSDNQILNFVNVVMKDVMTSDFGKIDYAKTSILKSKLSFKKPYPSVLIDVVPSEEDQSPSEVTDLYSPKDDQPSQYDSVRAEGLAIVKRIKQIVGTTYVDVNKPPQTDKDGKKEADPVIGYKDIAILSRAKGEYALEIYNVLLENNIPVIGSFKMKGLKNKEVRTLISLLRVIDNPHNDVAFVGVLLSPFCNLTEQQVAQIKIATNNANKQQEKPVKQSFYTQAVNYSQSNDDKIATTLKELLKQLAYYRLFSYGATVDQLLLEIVASTNFHLYVSSFPNASLRIKKMYEFIDQIKDKHYSQSVDKFLQFLDETSFEGEPGEDGIDVSAVKMMTMHASKGLEFPVVVVIGTKRDFKFDTGALNYDANNGIAFGYYDFENNFKSHSLGSFATKKIKKRNDMAEELRLLYVALTRAQNYLIIPLPNEDYKQWTSKRFVASDVDCFARWIMPATKRILGELEDGAQSNGVLLTYLNKFDYDNDNDENKGNTNSNDEKGNRNNESQDASTLQQLINQKEWQYSGKDFVAPSKIFSSSLDGKYLQAKENQEHTGITWQSLVTDTDVLQLGVAYHKVYETINYDANVQQISDHLKNLLQQNLISESIYQKLDVNLIYSTLSNPEFKQIVSSGKVYHERSFIIKTKHNQFVEGANDALTMLQGVVDLLVIGNNKATIVDFKYTSNSNNLQNRYKKQMQSYRFAVESILKLPVDCYFLSIADNKLIKVK